MQRDYIERIRGFTDGEVDRDENGAETGVRFAKAGVEFQVWYSERTKIACLEIRTGGLLLHYEFPEGEIEEYTEEFLEGGVHQLPGLRFLSQESGCHVLSLTRHGESYMVDPIGAWIPARTVAGNSAE